LGYILGDFFRNSSDHPDSPDRRVQLGQGLEQEGVLLHWLSGRLKEGSEVLIRIKTTLKNLFYASIKSFLPTVSID
jgi:hypothetical protein